MTADGWTQFVEHVETFLIYGLGLLVVLGVLTKSVKKLSRSSEHKRKDFGEDTQVQGSLEDLERAERELAEIPIHGRSEDLLKNFTLVEKYPTSAGYTRSYMDWLVESLERSEITSQYHFSQTLPLGVMSYSETPGVFELYIENNKLDEAVKAISDIKSSTT